MKRNFLFLVMIAIFSLMAGMVFMTACGDDDDDNDDDNDDDDNNDDNDDDGDDDDDAGDDDDDDDDDNDDNTTADCTLEEICTLAYDKCPDNDGWESVADCAGDDGWFSRCTGEMNVDAYMVCTCECFDATDSCEDFINDCEINCWNANCST